MRPEELDAIEDRARRAIEDFPGLNVCAADALRLVIEVHQLRALCADIAYGKRPLPPELATYKPTT